MNVKRIVNNLIECIKDKFLKINQLIKKLCDKSSPFIKEGKEASLKWWEKIYVKLPAWVKTRKTIIISAIIIIVGFISCCSSGGGNNSRIEKIYVQQFYSNLRKMERVYAESMANNNYASELRAKVRSGEIPVAAYRDWLRTSGYRYRPTNPMKNQIDAVIKLAAKGDDFIMADFISRTMKGLSESNIMNMINNGHFRDDALLNFESELTFGDLRCAYAYLIEKGYVNENGEWTKSGKHFIEITKIQKSVPKRFGNLNVDIATFLKLALDYLKEKETLNKKNDVPLTVAPLELNPRLDLAGKKPTLDSKYLSKDVADSIKNKYK